MSLPGESPSFNDSMDLFDDPGEYSPVDDSEELQTMAFPDMPRSWETTALDFQCPFCRELKSDEMSLQLHIQSSHPEDDSQNMSPKLDSPASGNAMNELLESGKTLTFVCPYCCGINTTKESLAQHLTLIHGEDLEHNELEEVIRSLDLLLCPLCVSVYSSPIEMQQHIDTQHSLRKEPHRAQPGQESASARTPPGNSLVTTCPVCGLDEPDSDLLVSHIETHFEASSSSAKPPNPSFPSTSKNTQAGHLSSSSSSSISSNSSKSSENKSPGRKKRNGYHYHHQYQKGLEKAVVKGEITPGDYHEHVAQMMEKDLNGADNGHSRIEGLVEQLESFYHSRSRQDQAAMLCGPTGYYCGSYGDRGWGCGYRNFQMMLSCLSRLPLYSRKLCKDGKIWIPSVSKIQEMIESAWQKGFDREGCQQLGGKVIHTRKWIGATEIVATLSSMGIRCELVDFPHPSSSDGSHPRLLQWVRDYFHKDHNAKPPLYLQHQGHSRTIVGVEVDKGTIRLILFDPSSSKEHVASLKNSQLTWKQMGSFRRNLAAFKAKQYQIVSVVGLLGREDYERSKCLSSTRIL